MSNMSYCRFTNTASDLSDCYEHIDDDDLSDEETRARIALIKICMDIADDFRHEVEE